MTSLKLLYKHEKQKQNIYSNKLLEVYEKSEI